jgi:CRISPR-associated Csx2 family protein
MSRKVFISVLGTNGYRECTYRGDKTETTTRYIQEATLQEIGANSWEEQDAVYILLTKVAREKNWTPEGGLDSAIKSLNLKCSVTGVDIADGMNEDQIWSIFNTVFNLLEDNDELYFDFTHGFRYLPMLVLVLGNYSKFLKKTTVAHMSYGNFEYMAAHPGEPAPIIDLVSLSVLQNWTFAAGQFLDTGNADRLSELGKSQCAEIKRKIKRKDIATDALNAYISTIKDISDKLTLCRGIDLINAKDIANMRDYQKNVVDTTIPAFGPVIAKITESFSRFCDTRNTANTYEAAKWCLEKNLYQQAITFLREGVVSILCDKYGLDIANESDRGMVDVAFRTKDPMRDKNEHIVVPNCQEEYGIVLSDPIFQDTDFVTRFNHLKDLRNDLNHSGMRESPASVKNLKKQIENAVAGLSIQSADHTPLPPIFINLSNHPIALWSDEQKTAAAKYGELMDMPFPDIDSYADNDAINKLAEETSIKIKEIAAGKAVTVHLMGEMTFTYALVRRLKDAGIRCVASTTVRDSVTNADGSKTSQFNFIRFRDYE